MHPTGIARGVGAAALAVTLALIAASGGNAARARAPVGQPFTVAAGFQEDYGAGRSALGPDGTVWLAQPGFGSTPSSGFEIFARGAGGRRLGPVATLDGAGSATDRPAIAADAGSATFVWQTASGAGGAGGVAEVRARRCTLAGCGAVGVLARWDWSTHGPVGGSGFTALGDAEPGVAIAGGRAVAVFYRDGGGGARMEWATATGAGRFGPARPLPGPGGPDAVVAPQAGGSAVAAWTVGALPSLGTGIEWSGWSARSGFGRPAALAGPTGATVSGLIAVPYGRGVALAWLQGARVSDPVPAEPVWVARRGAAGRFSPALRVFGGDAFGLSFAGAAGTLALAFTTATRPGASSAAPGPAWVKRSAAGAPFGAAAELDRIAAPDPAVAVADSGKMVAAWNDCRGVATGAASCAAQLAFAPAGAGFGAPVTLGAENRNDSPTLAASRGRTLVAWESGDAVRAVIATP